MPIDAARLAEANWQGAGMLASGGIPARTTIYATINASTYSDGASDARAGIQTALDACPSGQVVLLGPGLFRIENYLYVRSNTTLRGSGAGVTILFNPNGGVRADENQTLAFGNSIGLVVFGNSLFPHWLNTGLKTLTANAAQGATTITLDSVSGLTAGQYVVLSEDQFNTGAWVTKPLNGGSANIYENWSADRVSWARNRLVGTPVSISSSDAGTDRFTLASDLPFESGALVYLEGHSGTLSPTAADGYYRVYDKPTATTLRLQTAEWNGTIVDVTAGGTGGTVTANRPGEYQQAGGTIQQEGSWLSWHSRGHGHVYGECKRIESVNAGANQITFDSPVIGSYRTAYSAQVATNDTAYVENAGVEHMTLHRGANGAVSFLAAANCWAYGLDIYEWCGHGVHIQMSRRIHVEGVTVRYATWRQPGGGSYCMAVYDQSTECLIQNCIMVDANKGIAVNAAGAGCVLGYSHIDDTLVYSDLGWQEVGVNASHFAGSHHMLIEGCYAPNGDSDNTHGTSHAITYHRCHFSGQRASYTDSTNRRCFGLGYASKDMSLTGCVLGRPSAMTGWALAPTDFSTPSNPAIYKIGYDPGIWGQAQDSASSGSFYDADNWNYLNNAINAAEVGTTPNSYYLSAAPSFFGTISWPWVTPTAATKTAVLPAKYRWDQGDWNNLALLPGGEEPAMPAIEASTEAHGSGTTATLTHSAVAGRLLIAWLTTSGTTTITDSSGTWTAVPLLDIFSSFVARLYYKVATGSDTYSWDFGTSTGWTLHVVEASGCSGVLIDHAQQEQNSTTPESGTPASPATANALVFTGYADKSETVPIAQPSGYTALLPTPGGVLHYGTNFVVMGASAYKISSGASENAQWSRPDSGFAGVGVYLFEASAGVGGGATWMPGFTLEGGGPRAVVVASGMTPRGGA